MVIEMTPDTQTDAPIAPVSEEALPTEISDPRPLLRLGITILAALAAVFLLYSAHAFLSQETVATAGCATQSCD
jgi:hypothetical protein